MGDWGVLTPPNLSLPPPPPPLRSLPCDDVMAFYLLQGYPLILSLLLCDPLYLLLPLSVLSAHACFPLPVRL